MPEGDTIFRTAETMRRWLCGRVVSAARTTTGAPVERLVGETIEEIEARAKHLLIRCTGNITVHTHMKMTGSWHVYSVGDRWKRPASEARLVVECGERVAVCFNAPVIELIERRAEHLHPALARLGPDVMQPPLDRDDVVRRGAMQPPDRPIADVLLDQAFVGGIGNIWRSETLFHERVDPATPIAALPAERLVALAQTASRLMTRAEGRRGFSVYKRTGRPCPRCSTPIKAARFENGRVAYWCPRCQQR